MSADPREFLRKTGTLPTIAVEQATPPQAEILKQLFHIGQTLGRQDEQLDRILEQALRTNGRVTDLEHWRNDGDSKRSIEQASKDAVDAEYERRLRKPARVVAAIAKFVGLGIVIKAASMIFSWVKHIW